jgi:hypothetical protein
MAEATREAAVELGRVLLEAPGRVGMVGRGLLDADVAGCLRIHPRDPSPRIRLGRLTRHVCQSVPYA